MAKANTVFFKTMATFFGAGYGPKAPGTFGTIAAIPLYWILFLLGPQNYVLVTLVFTGFSIWVSEHAVKIWDEDDCQLIVIDEVAGFLFTMMFLPRNFNSILAGFVVFRLLDSIKPGPIRWFERGIPGGAGVVLDDVAAGVVGCILLNIAVAIWPHLFLA